MKTILQLLPAAQLKASLQILFGNHAAQASKFSLQPSYWQMSPAAREVAKHISKY